MHLPFTLRKERNVNLTQALYAVLIIAMALIPQLMTLLIERYTDSSRGLEAE